MFVIVRVVGVGDFGDGRSSRSCHCSSYEIATTRAHPIASPQFAPITRLTGKNPLAFFVHNFKL
jgi:hypothetical protein